MNETRATVLALIVGLAVMSGAFIGLASVNASAEILFFACFLPLAATSYANSLIVSHYADSERRRRR
jgi:heme A synthase